MSEHNPLWQSARARALIAAKDVAPGCELARQSRGWRQADLGKASGYSASTISRLETGRSTPADVDKLRRISREVGIPSYVLGELLGLLPAGADTLAGTTSQPPVEDDSVRRRSLLVAGLTVPLGLLTALDDALASLPAPAAAETADVALQLRRARRLFDTGQMARLIAGLPEVASRRAVQSRANQGVDRLRARGRLLRPSDRSLEQDRPRPCKPHYCRPFDHLRSVV